MNERSWQEFALLLIDVQEDFWEEDVRTAFPAFPENIGRLTDVCRRVGIEIVHIRARFSPDQSDWMVPYRLKGSIPCIAGTHGEKILECAREREGEKVIYKQTFDSFCNPELNAYLKEKGKRFLLTAGLVTSICVLLTTASAVQNGYLVSLVQDCSADEKEAHWQTLHRYRPIFLPQVTLGEITENKQRWQEQLDYLDNSRLDAKNAAPEKSS
jgi:nicotinamidase-related amidase